MSEERQLYRCRRTVLEMLRDRGYEIGDAEIEESFEEFQARQLTHKNMHIIAYKPLPGRTNLSAADDSGNPTQMKEPIFVAFAPDEKLGQEAFKGLLEYMDKWSKENKDQCITELLNAILVVKGASTQIFKKVSHFILFVAHISMLI